MRNVNELVKFKMKQKGKGKALKQNNFLRKIFVAKNRGNGLVLKLL